jgi:vancomycin permeability regulator SanA
MMWNGRRQMMGVNRFRQAARVTGNTARQAPDVNSATLINVNNVCVEGKDIGAKYAGFPTNDSCVQVAA